MVAGKDNCICTVPPGRGRPCSPSTCFIMCLLLFMPSNFFKVDNLLKHTKFYCVYLELLESLDTKCILKLVCLKLFITVWPN